MWVSRSFQDQANATMGPQTASNIASAKRRLQRDAERAHWQRQDDLAAVGIHETQIFGRFLVNNTGESIKELVFPVAFRLPPAITFGYELRGEVDVNKAPSVTAAVIKWISQSTIPPESGDGEPEDRGTVILEIPENSRPDNTVSSSVNSSGSQEYIGCKVLTTSRGPTNSKFIVHWSASGWAFTDNFRVTLTNRV